MKDKMPALPALQRASSARRSSRTSGGCAMSEMAASAPAPRACVCWSSYSKKQVTVARTRTLQALRHTKRNVYRTPAASLLSQTTYCGGEEFRAAARRTTYLPTRPGRRVGPPTTYLPRPHLEVEGPADAAAGAERCVSRTKASKAALSVAASTPRPSPGRRPVGRDGPSTRSSRLMSVIPDCSARRLLDHYLPTSAPPAAATADNYLPTYGMLPLRTT